MARVGRAASRLRRGSRQHGPADSRVSTAICRTMRCSSRTAASPPTGRGCSTIRAVPAGGSCRTADSPLSATDSPAASEARLAAPERPVVGLTGDAGFNMSLGELETARRLGLDFSIFVVNNAASGYVKALQHLVYGEEGYQSSDLVETDYARVAEAMGCRGVRVSDPCEIASAIAEALAGGERPDRHRRARDPRARPDAARCRQPRRLLKRLLKAKGCYPRTGISSEWLPPCSLPPAFMCVDGRGRRRVARRSDPADRPALQGVESIPLLNLDSARSGWR